MRVSAAGYAQKISLSRSNVPLKTIFRDIKNQSGYNFLYTESLLKNTNSVTIEVKNTELLEVLKLIFSKQPLIYEIDSKTVIVERKKNSLIQSLEIESPQTDIHGKVLNNDGLALSGASVKVKETNKVVSTNVNGEFRIDAKKGDILEISMVGYSTVFVTIGNETSLSIKLQMTNEELNEVVVVAYGTQKKVNLTGSVSSISVNEIKDRSNTNLLTSVQGKVPGVTIISRPNETPSINFRGRGNLLISAPLFVIDGVISDAGIFSNLDPNSIESVSFLKDAASSSIYGSRAAYGVVLVTTKSGKKGALNVSYNAFVGSKSSTYRPNMLNSWDYVKLYNEGLVNRGLAPLYTDEQIEWFKDGSKPDYYPNTKWLDLVLDKSAITTQHSLNFSGGTDKTRYFTSLGYLYDDQFMPGQNNKRYNFQTKLSSDVTNWLTLNTNVSYIRSQNDRNNGATSDYQMQYVPSTMVARQSNGEWGTISGGTIASQSFINYNPLRNLNKNDWAHNNSANTIIDLGFDLKPIKGLTISGQGSYTGTEIKNKNYTGLQNNVHNFITGSEIPGTGITINQMNLSWSNTMRMLYTATAKYNWKNDKHDLSVLGGTSYEHNRYEGLSASRKNFPTDDLTDLGAGSSAGPDITNGGGLYEFNLNSYFGRINYSYLGRYLFEGNIRTDGSSRFYKDSRWGVFPSFSAGWLISEESFLKKVNWINLLKFRGSYGVLGNINNVGNYDYFQSYNNSLGYNFEGQVVAGISESKPANTNLSWEKVAITDFGADLEILNQKLSLSLDYYIKNTSNILLAYNVPAEVGVSVRPSQNIGKVENKGLELALTYKNQVGGFHYTIGGNMSVNTNRITNLGGSDNTIYGGGDKINYIYKVGQPMGSYYGYVTDGLYTQAEIDKGEYYKMGRIPNAGDIKYVPQRSNVAWKSDITGDDRVVLGADVPKYTYSANISLEYKNFQLSVFGQGISGAQVAFENDALVPFFLGGNARTFHLQRWTAENPNPQAVYPRIYGGGTLDNYNNQFSQYSLFDADYFRIKNISLGYKIADRILKKYGISSARFFVNLENMFTIRADHKMKDFDPETASGRSLGIGIKTASVGINLTL
jgi:TonB-linked SusC/RagA family outer membrane protein